jgi:hypothetical protein
VPIGENGSGKSTIVETVAMAFGLSSEGGSRGATHSTRQSESDLWRGIRLERSPGASRWGFFLRAETMHGFYTYLEDHPGVIHPRLHELSHGESFRGEPAHPIRLPGAGLPRRARGRALLLRADRAGRCLARARILEVGEWGLRTSTYDDLQLVAHWKRSLDEPMRYLRHIL